MMNAESSTDPAIIRSVSYGFLKTCLINWMLGPYDDMMALELGSKPSCCDCQCIGKLFLSSDIEPLVLEGFCSQNRSAFSPFILLLPGSSL